MFPESYNLKFSGLYYAKNYRNLVAVILFSCHPRLRPYESYNGVMKDGNKRYRFVLMLVSFRQNIILK